MDDAANFREGYSECHSEQWMMLQISSAILFMETHSARVTCFFFGSNGHGDRISKRPSATASNKPSDGLMHSEESRHEFFRCESLRIENEIIHHRIQLSTS
jgi:hypothetical protein